MAMHAAGAVMVKPAVRTSIAKRRAAKPQKSRRKVTPDSQSQDHSANEPGNA